MAFDLNTMHSLTGTAGSIDFGPLASLLGGSVLGPVGRGAPAAFNVSQIEQPAMRFRPAEQNPAQRQQELLRQQVEFIETSPGLTFDQLAQIQRQFPNNQPPPEVQRAISRRKDEIRAAGR